MGCVASKLGDEEEVVSMCRERKRLIKLAVERRHALADAHSKYFQAMYAVSAAIKLFVGRHKSPSSPFLITFTPPNGNPSSPPTEQSNPLFLEQKPAESTHEAIACGSCNSSSISTVSSEEESREEEAHEQIQEQQHCGYFYMQMPPPMPSPHTDFGWDFFNPFDGVRTEIVGGYNRSGYDDLKLVREEEGIPELEDERDVKEEEKNVVFAEEKNGPEVAVSEAGLVKVEENIIDSVHVNQGEQQKGLTVNHENGRELLEALKDIEDHFIRASDSGKDVSRMLEANMLHLKHSDLDEIKEISAKKTLAITWHRSISSKPPSCKSLVATTSKSSSTWTEFRNDLFDEYGGMDSGSHSLTLGRLYAWEKKLYEEVKAGDDTRKLYEKKCLKLESLDARGHDEHALDKTRAAVKDLYARILVAVRSAESISKRIEKLRDEELEAQVIELLKGLTRTWRVTLECHETQNKILCEVKHFACPTYGKFCKDSHRLATLQLETELQNWRACFTEYIGAQRAYVQVLHDWLAKFVVVPEVEFYSRGTISSGANYGRSNGPPLLMICQSWLACLNRLPDTAVAFALKSFSKDVLALWAQQGEEQQQKRKVDSMAKELDRKAVAYQKLETRFLEFKLTETGFEPELENQGESITVKRDQMSMLRERLEMEKEKHQRCMQETQRITLSGFQTGFTAVFESLAEFGKACQKMYNDVVIQSREGGEPVVHRD